jgi:hypothetical protein
VKHAAAHRPAADQSEVYLLHNSGAEIAGTRDAKQCNFGNTETTNENRTTREGPTHGLHEWTRMAQQRDEGTKAGEGPGQWSRIAKLVRFWSVSGPVFGF